MQLTKANHHQPLYREQHHRQVCAEVAKKRHVHVEEPAGGTRARGDPNGTAADLKKAGVCAAEHEQQYPGNCELYSGQKPSWTWHRPPQRHAWQTPVTRLSAGLEGM